MLSLSHFRSLTRSLSRLLLRLTVRGIENIPCTGGVLLAMNHLGDADSLLVFGFTPRPLTIIGKSEILDWPVLGWLVQFFGMLPIRRGQPDRVGLKLALDVLESGGALLIAPEGRESHSKALEPAKGGAAFLAIQSGVPIVPIAITGTESVYREWLHFRRPCVTLTFDRPLCLLPGIKRRAASDLIMQQIASLLPVEYRGVYAK